MTISLPMQAMSPNLMVTIPLEFCRFIPGISSWLDPGMVADSAKNMNRGNNPEGLTEDAHKLFDINVLGNIHLINLFVPLLLKGEVKKVIVISSGHADTDVIAKYEVANAPVYSATKAAMNVIIAKFHAQYKKDGILFLAISPGAVEVGHNPNRMETPLTLTVDSVSDKPPL